MIQKIVEYRNVSSLPAQNPFNQSLNTTDSPTFNNVTVNGNLNATQGNLNNVLQINNTNITVSPQSNGYLLMSPGSNISIQDGFIQFFTPTGGPTSPVTGGFNASLYKFGGNLLYNATGTPWILNQTYNYYNYQESLGTLPVGTYEIQYQCQLGTNSSGTDSALVDFVADSVNQNGESCDSGLSSFTFKLVYGSATTHTYAIQYRSNGSSTAHIRDARIFIRQVQ